MFDKLKRPAQFWESRNIDSLLAFFLRGPEIFSLWIYTQRTICLTIMFPSFLVKKNGLGVLQTKSTSMRLLYCTLYISEIRPVLPWWVGQNEF